MSRYDHDAAGAPWPPPVAVVAVAAPAGWYDDPHRRAALRWWDGASWTDHEHGAGSLTVPLRGAVVGLAVLLAARIAVEVGIRPLRDGSGPLWLVALAFYAAVFGAMAWSARRGLAVTGGSWAWLRGQVRMTDVGTGLLVWLCAVVAGIMAISVVRGLGLPFRSNADVVTVYRDRNAPLFFVTAIAAVAVAPVVEEMFFRGLVQRGLASRWSARVAVALQGIAFGAYHVIPAYGLANVGLVVALTSYGWVFGAWAARTGRLGPTIVGHTVANAVVFAVTYAT